jgi:hypothetical protein
METTRCPYSALSNRYNLTTSSLFTDVTHDGLSDVPIHLHDAYQQGGDPYSGRAVRFEKPVVLLLCSRIETLDIGGCPLDYGYVAS